MRIDSLKSSPDRMGRYLTSFSDGTVLKLYRQTVEDFGLYPGKEMSDSDYDALRAAAGEMSAKMRAVRIIAASSVSKRDLEQRLVHKGEDPDHARQAVAWLEEKDLVNDRETALQVVRSCAGKGYGIARAKQALYEKRIPKEYWQEALADYPDQSDRIDAFLRSRLEVGCDQKDIQRAVAALVRRGHTYGQIRESLERLSLETEIEPEEE